MLTERIQAPFELDLVRDRAQIKIMNRNDSNAVYVLDVEFSRFGRVPYFR